MGEKNYGGSSNIPKGKFEVVRTSTSEIKLKEKNDKLTESLSLTYGEIENYRKAGKIASQVRDYARKIIKKNMKLVEVADKIEGKILELGGELAFPVNLSIDEVAAHFSPNADDEKLAEGLLKIDLGVSFNGYIADLAFSIDLENNEENKKLIEASENALKEALKIISKNIEIWEIGKKIQEVIESYNFSPVKNLSGHSLSRYLIHSGFTLPNYNDGNKNKLPEGAYALEPFATSGVGMIYESRDSGIYSLVRKQAVRDSEARKLLDFIEKKYKTMPFCKRWLEKDYGKKINLALSMLEKAGSIRAYPELVEKSKKKVAQAEHSFIIFEDRVEIITI